ncbi:hypothetical protein ACIRQP_09425 [Streptomyces sp. NPDC102274]|uniref:hypothetical protein n=1 Tax=Streptomyces sp. NPDC102274 TaxID=3366151 RepID=UPI00382954C0
MSATQRIASGRTAPGQGWKVYSPTGIYIEVNTSSAEFTGTPTYVSSLGGDGTQWAFSGASAIYAPTRNGFVIYLRWLDNSPLTPAYAAQYNFHINWIGIDET